MAAIPFMTMGLFTVVLSALFFVGWFDGTSIVFPSSSLRRRAAPTTKPQVKAAVSTGPASSAPKSTATPAKAPVQQPPSATPAAPATTSKAPAPVAPAPSSKAPATVPPSLTSTKALSSSKSLISSVSHNSSSTHPTLTLSHTPAPALNSASHFPSEQPSPSVLPSPSQSLVNDSSSSSSILHDGQTTALVFTFVGIIAAFVVAGIIVLLWRRARALSRASNLASAPDMEEFRGIRRANSTSTGENRPASTSGFSEPEYNWQYTPPQRFATSPIHQQPLDLNSFAADPVSVHYTIYPDILPPPPAARPVSPDSMYDDDSVYDGIQRRQQVLQRLRERRI